MEKKKTGRCKKQRSKKVNSKKKKKIIIIIIIIIIPKSKKPAPKVIVDDVDIEQKNQNEHIDVETENVFCSTNSLF